MRISYSRIATYGTCPQQYKLQYVDRVWVPTAPALHFGAAIHEALDSMYSPKHLRRPTREHVIETFVQAWRAREGDVVEERRQSYFEQGVEMLTRHYDRHVEQKKGRTTAATEQFFSIPFEDAHTLSGRIDRVDVLPENRLEIIDYKTTRRMPPPRDMERNPQLAIYRMAADHLYPGREVTTTLLYLVHDYEMRLTQTAEMLAENRGLIRDVIAGIQSVSFEPSPGGHCDWCAYRTHCPLFREPVEPDDLDIDIAEELRKCAEAIAAEQEAKRRRSQAQALIHSYLDRCGAERVEGGGYVAERRSHKRVVAWDLPRLREVLAPLGVWDQITEVNSSAVRKLLDAKDLDREQQRAVEAAAEHVETRQLRVRPLNGAGDDEETRE
jgi:putative RecB family exonuclease